MDVRLNQTNHPSIILALLDPGTDDAGLLASFFESPSLLIRDRAFHLLAPRIKQGLIKSSVVAAHIIKCRDGLVCGLGIQLLMLREAESVDEIIKCLNARMDLIGIILNIILLSNASNAHPSTLTAAAVQVLNWIVEQKQPLHTLRILERAGREGWVDVLFKCVDATPDLDDQVQACAMLHIKDWALNDKEWDRGVHFLAARVAYFWVHNGVFDMNAFNILNSIVQHKKEIDDVLVLKVLILLTSMIQLDLVANKEVQSLLVRVCKDYLVRVPGDDWITISVLPVLSCLAMESVIAVDKGIFLLLQSLESLLATSVNVKSPLESPPYPLNNPYYSSLVEMCKAANPPTYKSPNLFPSIKTLFLARAVFSNSADPLLLSKTLNTVTQDIRTQDLLSFMYMYIYLINKHPHTASFLLKECIPALAAANDVFLTSSSLKIILTLLQGGKGTRKLDATAFQALLNLLTHQRRIFPHLKKYLSSWMNMFKQSRGAGRLKTDLERKREDELEVIATESIRGLCISDPHNWGKELLPIIISLLKISDRPDFGSTRAVSEKGAEYLIAAFNACIEGEVAAPMTAWNVLFKSYYESINDETYPIIAASICDFFALVAIKTDPESEKEVEFRGEILNLYLAPLITHKDLLVRDHAFRALSFFPFEDASSFIPSPVELIDQLQRNEIPKHAALEFLGKKIEEEVRDMPRPVFKGLAVESGVKASSSTASSKKEDKTEAARIQAQAKLVTEAWVSGHRNRAGLAPASLFLAYLETPGSFKTLCGLGMRDISTSLSSPLQVLDFRQGWHSFCMNALNQVGQKDGTDDEKMGAVKEFVEKQVRELVEVSESSTIPSTVAASIMISTSLITASFGLQCSPSFETVSMVLESLKAKLGGSKRVAKEVETAVVLSLVDLLQVLHHDQDGDEVLSIVWSRCLAADMSRDEFIFSFSASRIVIHEMSLSSQKSRAMLDAFLARFLKDGEWRTLGAAFGFAAILASPLVDIVEWMDEKMVEGIVQNSFNSLSESLKSGNLDGCDCNALILSAGFRFAPYPTSEVFDLVSNVLKVAKESENAILYTCVVRVQVLLENPSDVASKLLDCIKQGSSVSRMLNSFDGLRILLGRDFGSQQQSLLSKENLWNVIHVCQDIVLNHSSPVLVRASGWTFGLALSSLSTILSGSSAMSNSMDPKDYRRLNVESSYLKASFDALTTTTPEISVELFRNVFLCLKRTLPPVDWVDVLASLKGRGVAELECLQFASRQASERGSKYLVSFLLDSINQKLPLCLDDSDLTQFIYSTSGFGKLLELAGVGSSKTSSASIPSLSMQTTLLSALRTLPLNKADRLVLGLLSLVQRAISMVAEPNSKVVKDLQELLWTWIVDSGRRISSHSDYEAVRLVILSLKDMPAMLKEAYNFSKGKITPSTMSVVCLANLALLQPTSYMTEFLGTTLQLAKTTNGGAMEAAFILNWTTSNMSCNGAEEQLAFVSKVLDLFILSIGDSISNLPQFVWLYLVLPTVWTLCSNHRLDIRSENDWTLVQSQACVCLIGLLRKTNSASKYKVQVQNRLLKVKETLDNSVSFMLEL